MIAWKLDFSDSFWLDDAEDECVADLPVGIFVMGYISSLEAAHIDSTAPFSLIISLLFLNECKPLIRRNLFVWKPTTIIFIIIIVITNDIIINITIIIFITSADFH